MKAKKILPCLASSVAFAAAMLISGPSAGTAAATPPQQGAPPPPPPRGMPPPPPRGMPPPPPGNEPWAVPNSRWQAVQQRGYRDGVTGARRDAQNHRQPNVNNRDEYRKPPVSGHDQRAYRDGFRQGYWAGVQHLMGYYRGPYGR